MATDDDECRDARTTVLFRGSIPIGSGARLGPPLDQCAITRVGPIGAGADFSAFVNGRAALPATV
jgi:hypothetical protein